MADRFIENRDLLEEQPKRVIANYVKQSGLLVPKIFGSLEEAVQDGRRIFVRSEHPQDYDGISNLFYSGVYGEIPALCGCALDIKRTDYELLRKHMLLLPHNRINNFRRDEGKVQELKDGVSYSFWEFLEGGQNRTIIADSSVRGRYHIFTNLPRGYSQWTIFEDGKIIFGEQKADSDLKQNFPCQIEFYETVRNLDAFNPNHCPSIEYQSMGKDNFFLQYFRTNDFQEADFVLDRDLEDGEVKADWVRGVTPKGGIQRRIYFPQMGGTYLIDKKTKTRLAHFPSSQKGLERYLYPTHERVTEIFKPTIYVCRRIDELYTNEELKILFLKSDNFDDLNEEQMKFEPPTLRFISDGRTAYIKRMD
ncbi:hypothetical protein KAI32_02560 [Candidatus Pacearchaeota archaeon]|nr:hypothetical protein [Candidatus Pacearchaeota archaeon]